MMECKNVPVYEDVNRLIFEVQKDII